MSIATTTEAKPAAPAVETITVKVDGKAIAVPKTMLDPITGKPVATTMIQATSLAKIDHLLSLSGPLACCSRRVSPCFKCMLACQPARQSPSGCSRTLAL